VRVETDLGELYQLHADDLVAFACALVGPVDAVDVVSSAVLATIERNSLDGVIDVRAYWFRAVANTAASWHRSRFRRRNRETRASALANGRVVEHEAASDARRVLAQLTPQQRAVVYLTYWHDLTPGRVAVMLDVSEGAVRKQLARSREQLRRTYRP
jgi:RNA polymerase sigma factor (sigma-70 family)